jgi:hypothetical protein
MASERHFSHLLALTVIAVLAGGLIFTAAEVPVAECRFCGGTGLITLVLTRGDEWRTQVPCDYCRGLGKVGLIRRWEENWSTLTFLPPR